MLNEWRGIGELEQLFQLARGVAEILSTQNRARFHEFAALDIVLHRIDAVERNNAPAFEIDDRETAFRRITSHDGSIVSDRKTGSLQLEIELFGPEPR
ncbi:hypothetical protein GCM10023208_21290 [Erythrobacter westpacificensis]|uniref:Uncharacterized protein n=1 Tax=Erythrobacter westpacificensis TaxID=1055231 RepID=A0ABP9KD67_9SPHN